MPVIKPEWAENLGEGLGNFLSNYFLARGKKKEALLKDLQNAWELATLTGDPEALRSQFEKTPGVSKEFLSRTGISRESLPFLNPATPMGPPGMTPLPAGALSQAPGREGPPMMATPSAPQTRGIPWPTSREGIDVRRMHEEAAGRTVPEGYRQKELEPDWMTRQALLWKHAEEVRGAQSQADIEKSERALRDAFKRLDYAHALKQPPADTRHLNMIKEMRTRIQSEREGMIKSIKGGAKTNPFMALSLDDLEQKLKSWEVTAAENEGVLPPGIKAEIQKYYQMTQSGLLKTAQGETASQNLRGLLNLISPTRPKEPKINEVRTATSGPLKGKRVRYVGNDNWEEAR